VTVAKTLLLLAVVALSSDCAALRVVAPTIEDIGLALCKSYYGEHQELLGGETPAAICAIAEILRPFVDGARAARLAAAAHANAALAARP